MSGQTPYEQALNDIGAESEKGYLKVAVWYEKNANGEPEIRARAVPHLGPMTARELALLAVSLIHTANDLVEHLADGVPDAYVIKRGVWLKGVHMESRRQSIGHPDKMLDSRDAIGPVKPRRNTRGEDSDAPAPADA